MLLKIKNKIFREFLKIKVIILRNFHLNRINNFNKIILILVPNNNGINGGILSIATIYNEFCNLKKIHDCQVLACTSPYNSKEYFLKFSKFNNNMLVFDFKSILKKINATTELHLHIPELFVKDFVDSFENNWAIDDKIKLKKIAFLHINILNQNDLFMPENIYIEKLKNLLTQNVTMSVAHKNYATIEKKKQYNIPLHYLSAWLNPKPYVNLKFENKKNIIVFSPDELSRLNINYHLSKQDLINQFGEKLPDFQTVIVENLNYENYKKLVSNCKFMITFGEGLDAYFIETVLSGGISFAIYNDVFFSENYKTLPTIYKNVDELFQNIENDILFYNNKTNYDNYNKTMKDICEIEYSYPKYQARVKNFITGNYDFK